MRSVAPAGLTVLLAPGPGWLAGWLARFGLSGRTGGSLFIAGVPPSCLRLR